MPDAKPVYEKTVVRNRRASHDYELGEVFTAGLMLQGSEVKSIRLGRVEVIDAYISVENDEAFVYQLRIDTYDQATAYQPDVRRRRKLLLHKGEIRKLGQSLEKNGLTAVVTRVFFTGRHAKIDLALAKGRTKGDKREAIAKKEADRDLREAMGRKLKGAQ
jgi:SsrA-binding protein